MWVIMSTVSFILSILQLINFAHSVELFECRYSTRFPRIVLTHRNVFVPIGFRSTNLSPIRFSLFLYVLPFRLFFFFCSGSDYGRTMFNKTTILPRFAGYQIIMNCNEPCYLSQTSVPVKTINDLFNTTWLLQKEI